MDAVSQAISGACGSINGSFQTVWIAYSGGLDSHVLLHAMSEARQTFPELTLKAIHVNHQLQSCANDWEAHCIEVCAGLYISCETVKVNAQPKPGQSPEDAARQARYQAFENLVEEGDVVLTAHHLDDQAETLLLQLMRGSGIAGLAGMPEQRQVAHYSLWRPLLATSRNDLLAYAKHHKLEWIEDPSNRDTDIRRNFIRHEIMPGLQQQWSNANELITQSASHLADSYRLLSDYLDSDLEKVLIAQDVLKINALIAHDRTKQFHIIRHWYKSLGLAKPGVDKLTVILDEIIAAREDATPCLRWQNSQLIRQRDYLVLLPAWSDITAATITDYEGAPMTTDYWTLAIDDHNAKAIEVRFGDYSGSVKVNGQTKKLKQLFKERGVPVQLRGYIPQVYFNNELVLIPDVWQSEKRAIDYYYFDFNRLGSASRHHHSLLSTLATW